MSNLALAPKGPIEFLHQLEQSGALTSTSLDLGEHPISFDAYEALAAFLGAVGRSHCWWVGDLINWGEMVFGEEAAQAIESLGLHPGTCVNYAYTCRQIARSRRRPGLSFAHHRVVAPLSPDAQRYWLDRASAEAWTRSDLDREVAAMRPGEETVQPVYPDEEPLPVEVQEVAMLEGRVMEVVHALVAFEGEIGHHFKCWIREGDQEKLDCVCGLARLERAVAALGIEW